ncbi:MAG: VWA domain-containing protein [Thermomicrobiales bacterium]
MHTPHPLTIWTRRIRVRLAPFAAGASLLALLAAPVAAQDTPTANAAAQPGAVNIELILDVSGSMAEPLGEGAGQTRMAAARSALREVISGMPDDAPLNVGLRLYGHVGSNAETDRARSCRTTELVAPLTGIDRTALLARIDGATPTGWTPLARALQDAAADFAPGERSANAIIMVTDGEDTCGGDPCAVAAALHAADVAVTTHVVGLALTSDQQAAVRCIAEEGGGQLFTAGNADSLRGAIETAYQEVVATPAPATAEVELRGYLGGNAFAALPEAEDGALAVVAVGAYDGSHLPVVIQNRTGADVQLVEVSAMARKNGALIASGSDQGLAPLLVEADGYAFGDIYFGTELADGAEFSFTLQAQPANEADASWRDLTVSDANATGDLVIAILQNDHEVGVGGVTITADVACFDASGSLLDVGFGPAGATLLAPGASAPAQFGLPEASADLQTETCPLFLIAGHGDVAP